MTSQEFVIWLKGFTEGVHEYNITPKQWDLLKEKLTQVTDQPRLIGTAIGPPYYGGTGIPNHAVTTGTPNHDLVNRFGSGNPSVTLGYLSGSYLGTTSTATNLPPGTTVTYTTSGGPTWYSINKIENDSREK